MLGALPAIGFLSTGVGMGVGHLAAFGAIAGFSATLTGPPNLSTGGTNNGFDHQGTGITYRPNYDFLGSHVPGTTSGYDFQGSHVPGTTGGYDFLGSHVPGTTGGYDFLGSHVPNYTGGYDLLGSQGSYNLTGHLSNAVWNLNASPWNDVSYGAICDCGSHQYSAAQASSSYSGLQYAANPYPAHPYPAPSFGGAQGPTQSPPSPYPLGYNPNSEFPYNNVQYVGSSVPPASYLQSLGSYDASSAFGGPIFGSFGAYSQAYGFPAPQGQMPFGYCQPAYTNPANYVYPPQTTQTYTLQSHTNGMFNHGAYGSSYQPYMPPAPPPPPAQPPVVVDGCHTDGNGRVLYQPLPTFEDTDSWVNVYEIVASRTVGSPENADPIHYSGNAPMGNADGRADERTTVWWALQQNDRLRYNADSKEFFITYPDGSTRAVDTLPNLLNVRQSAGWDGQVAYKAFGDRLQEVMVTSDLIYPPYQPGASSLTTRQFGTQWDNIFPRPNNAALFGYNVPNLGPQTTLIPPNGVG